MSRKCEACGRDCCERLCVQCAKEGWDEVACPRCEDWHLQAPDGLIMAACAWSMDQNDIHTEEPDYGDAALDEQLHLQLEGD